MNRFKVKYKNWNTIIENFQFYVFILVVVIMPFTKTYLPHIMFLWVLSGALNFDWDKLKLFKTYKLLIFPIIFFLTLLFGLFYSDDLKNGVFDLEVKLSLFFLPFVTLFLKQRIRNNHRLVLKLFVFSNLIASLACLWVAFNNSLQIGEAGNIIIETSAWPTLTQGLSIIKLINLRYSYFSYNYLSVFHHSTYFSIYILFSIISLIYLLRSMARRKFGYYILIIFFSIFLWLLGSRAAYFTYLILLAVFLVILILRLKKYWIGLGVLALGIFLSIVVLPNSQIRKNINETLELVKDKPLNENSDIRLWLWKSGLEVFQENFWFGVGTGDIDEALNNKYVEYDLKLADEHNYNAHNQYLDTALKLGVVGLALLLFWIGYTLYITAQKKQFLFFFFMLILAINFMFEVMLNTIAGVSFFAFFYSLLYAIYNTGEIKKVG